MKTLDDTLLIEGRHEDVRDRDNYTKMVAIREGQIGNAASALVFCPQISIASGRGGPFHLQPHRQFRKSL